MKKHIISTLILTGTFASIANAAIVGIYSFTGAADGAVSGFSVESPAANLNFSDLTSDFTDIGVVSAFAASAQYDGGAYTPYVFDGKGYEVGYDKLQNASIPGLSGSPTTAASSNYLQFSVTAAPGFLLDVESVSIDFGTDFTTSFTPSVYYNLYYSVDATNWYVIGATSEATSNSNVYKIRNDVTKPFVENVAAGFNGGESLTFRLVFGDGGSGSADKRLFVDDINLSGSVTAVPEPSTYALFSGVIAFGLILYRRKRAL